MKELLDKIKENRFEDIELQMKLCEQLYKQGQQQKNEYVQGAALFYHAEAMYGQSAEQAEEYAQKALTILSGCDDYELLARAYNLLGILANNKENLSVALENLLSCNKICEEHSLKHIQGLCTCNIGVIYQLLESYEKSIQYFLIAIDCFKESQDQTFTMFNITSIYLNVFICYLKMENVEQMGIYLDLIRKNREYVEPIFSLELCEAQYYEYTKDYEKMEETLAKVVGRALSQTNAIDYMDFYQILCELLDRQERYDTLLSVLDEVEKVLDEDSFPRVRIVFLKYRLQCLEKKADFSEYAKWTKEYVKTYELIDRNYHRSVLESVNLRMYVEELKLSESEYEQKSMTDNLTQIYNRYGFHRFTQPLMEKAAKNHENVSLSIIDLDYFKQVNDAYGHGYGDQCLVSFANLLKSFQKEDVFVGRYGGDEFVLFTYGKRFQEVEEISESLQKKLADLAIESKGSSISKYLTISQGIYYGVPTGTDTVFTFLHEADAALYEVKRRGRNHYGISSS